MIPFFKQKNLNLVAFTRLSLPGQLAVLLGCLLFCLWVSIAFSLQYLYDRTLKENDKETQNLVRMFAEEIQSSVHSIDLTLIDLREWWQEEPESFSTKVQSRQTYLGKDVVFQVSIINSKGRLVYSSVNPIATSVNLSDREHFRVHRDHNEDVLFISKPVLGRVSQRWSIQFTRPLIDGHGKFDGVIVLSVSPDYFSRFSHAIELGAGGSIALVRGSGEVIARTPMPVHGLGQQVQGISFLNATQSNIGTFQRVSQSDGIYRQYTWRSLSRYKLVVVVGRAMDNLLAPYVRQKRIYLWGGMVISVLFTLIGYTFLVGLRHRAKTREALEESEFRWKYALEGAGDGVWDWNLGTGEVFYSKQWKEMLGYAEHEIKNHIEAWETLIHPEDKPRILAAAADYISGDTETYTNEYRLRCKDKTWKWIFSRGMAIRRDPKGRAVRLIGTHTDITERKRAEEAERDYLASYDALTGLANRHLLRDRLYQAINRAANHTEQIWVIYINLDRFKFVNETLGHEAGDVLLQLVARRIQAVLRSTDTASRVAGDEFVLVVSEAVDEHTLMTIVQQVMEAIAHPLTIEGHEYFLSCTMGIAVYPSNGTNAETLIKQANIAMRRCKEMGRNKFYFYTEAMNERAMDRLRLESDLRYALERNELMLHFQPQVNLRTGRIVGMEALLRWHHPRLGLVPPDRFIRIAEETGLIVRIGDWVIRTACQQARKWQLDGFGSLQISVNLSGNQFYQPDLIQSIKAILQDTGLEARYLDIELTERLVMKDVEQTMEIMFGLKQLGVKLSLDDFGTGYSSLSYLKRFPIDVLKIDQSFVRNITTDPNEAAIARSIITLAQSLRMQVIAEGVETEQQLAYLRRHRCDQIQGHYFSQALSAHDFDQLLIEDKCLPQPDHPVNRYRQTMLIVDDEEKITASLYRLLRRDGFQILRAHSAQEGLSLLALHEVQVVVSDQRMPEMTGTEFLSKVKDLYPDTIRIMLSGYTAVESIIEATNSGAVFRFHTKPWDDKVLRASIAEAFRYHWLMHKEDYIDPDLVTAMN